MSEPPSSRQSTWGSGVLQLGYPARWPSRKTKKKQALVQVCTFHMRPSIAWVGNSATGTRTRAARVRAEYPGQLDCSGF